MNETGRTLMELDGAEGIRLQTGIEWKGKEGTNGVEPDGEGMWSAGGVWTRRRRREGGGEDQYTSQTQQMKNEIWKQRTLAVITSAISSSG